MLASRTAVLSGALALSLFVVDCLDTRSDVDPADGGVLETPEGGAGGEAPTGPTVRVDLSSELAVVPTHAFGMHSSVYDNALHNAAVPGLLRAAGITLLRYPGGGYSDNYHWSTHAMTPSPDSPDDTDTDPEVGYLARGSDFGSYVGLIESFDGAMMITVNYGSNLQGDGPGEPKEASAWVAYANGDPANTQAIGVDGSGNDWRTVGYWASLRESERLPDEDDDGLNFLRIEHPEPLGIEYWEIGNEIFGNGWNESNPEALGFEFDLHYPYDGTPRYHLHELSGSAYGAAVLDYIDAMKAVDPTIKVGAVLATPPADAPWGTLWNEQVLTECAGAIDFVIVHWYPNPPGPSGTERTAALLTMPRGTIPTMVDTLRASIARHRGENSATVELTMTELGPHRDVGIPTGIHRSTEEGQPPTVIPSEDRRHAIGIFAADTYLSAIEHGFQNLDWLELHNGSFLDEGTQAKGPAYGGIQMAHLLAAPGDSLVTTTSNVPSIVAHAARRPDGGVGVLLINTQPPELNSVSLTVVFRNGAAGTSGQRYDYAPPMYGASGTVTGPVAFTDLESPFEIEVAQYGVVLLVFDPPE